MYTHAPHSLTIFSHSTFFVCFLCNPISMRRTPAPACICVCTSVPCMCVIHEIRLCCTSFGSDRTTTLSEIQQLFLSVIQHFLDFQHGFLQFNYLVWIFPNTISCVYVCIFECTDSISFIDKTITKVYYRTQNFVFYCDRALNRIFIAHNFLVLHMVYFLSLALLPVVFACLFFVCSVFRFYSCVAYHFSKVQSIFSPIFTTQRTHICTQAEMCSDD